jgi:hypothetical protein
VSTRPYPWTVRLLSFATLQLGGEDEDGKNSEAAHPKNGASAARARPEVDRPGSKAK